MCNGLRNRYLCFIEYIATQPFREELFETDTAVPNATDLTKAFQSILNSCNAITLLRTQVKAEPEVSLNGERYNSMFIIILCVTLTKNDLVKFIINKFVYSF